MKCFYFNLILNVQTTCSESSISLSGGMSSWLVMLTIESLGGMFSCGGVVTDYSLPDSVGSVTVLAWFSQSVCSHLTLSSSPANLPANTFWHTRNHWALWKHSSLTPWNLPSAGSQPLFDLFPLFGHRQFTIKTQSHSLTGEWRVDLRGPKIYRHQRT